MTNKINDFEIIQEGSKINYENAIDPVIEKLDTNLGALFASSFEYPGRYTCWDIGFYNPPITIYATQDLITTKALNDRGLIIINIIKKNIDLYDLAEVVEDTENVFVLQIKHSHENYFEEHRSQKPSVFTFFRELIALFKAKTDEYLGLYGAFGYDLIFQFEDIEKHQQRDSSQIDLKLYLPDQIYLVNHRKEEAFIINYEFSYNGKTTKNMPRDGIKSITHSKKSPETLSEYKSLEYASVIEKAKGKFKNGELFEVVPSQTFYRKYHKKPSTLFQKMKKVNPSPYGFLINLGDNEHLIGASPEMYVRVKGDIVETCPISGTIKRGQDALSDAENIKSLLSSLKEESELTMCTDVDRNDKSRICEANSVEVVGRRQIEMYSRLIHTVDHVKGKLRQGFDSIDAFLTHMWVVTVTGAPKLWAMKFIEKHEKSPRRWYGGAVGWLNFSGDINTGLVLRTVRLKDGIAEVRAGATLLFDSDPRAEEEETKLKASAFLSLLTEDNHKTTKAAILSKPNKYNKRVLLIDHEDSFVHTLGNYFRQTGAKVDTIRHIHVQSLLLKTKYDLVVLSPGPGRPKDFKLSRTIELIIRQNIPIFGVCLGLQGIVEYFGGKLHVLNTPVHGKPSEIKKLLTTKLLDNIAESFTVGRYHSLYASPEEIPEQLIVTSATGDGIVMSIEHKTLPIYAVQFHPETILSMHDNVGMQIIKNMMGIISVCKKKSS